MLNLRYFWNRAVGVSRSCCGDDAARVRRRKRRRSANEGRRGKWRSLNMAGVWEGEGELGSDG